MKLKGIVSSLALLLLAAGVAGAAAKSPATIVGALRKAIAKHDKAQIQALLPTTGTVHVTSGAGSGDEEPAPKDMDAATLAAELADPQTTVGTKVTCKKSCCKIAHKDYKDPSMALMTIPVSEICVEKGVVKSLRFDPVGA